MTSLRTTPYSVEYGEGTVQLVIQQSVANQHALDFVVITPEGMVFSVQLDERQLHDLFYWFSMHMSNCNRIQRGLAPFEHWDGKLVESPEYRYHVAEQGAAAIIRQEENYMQHFSAAVPETLVEFEFDFGDL